jgi:hypothetical protein
MSHRILLRHTDAAGPDARRLPLSLQGRRMQALAELPCRAALGSFSTVAIAVVSALALIASQGGA